MQGLAHRFSCVRLFISGYFWNAGTKKSEETESGKNKAGRFHFIISFLFLWKVTGNMKQEYVRVYECFSTSDLVISSTLSQSQLFLKTSGSPGTLFSVLEPRPS